LPARAARSIGDVFGLTMFSRIDPLIPQDTALDMYVEVHRIAPRFGAQRDSFCALPIDPCTRARLAVWDGKLAHRDGPRSWRRFSHRDM
jgi:hypothetical protein